jgi:hypothetical protein
MANEGFCPLCEKPCLIRGEDIFKIQCSSCGFYNINREARDDLPSDRNIENGKLVMVSAFTRHRTILNLPVINLFLSNNHPSDITPRITIREVINDFPLMSDRLDLALLNLVKLSRFSGDRIVIERKDYPIFFPDSKELSASFFIIKQLIDDGYIDGNVGFPAKLMVLAKGWKRASEIEKGNITDSKQAFTAMWFDNNMLDIFNKYISKAVKDAGYDPFIIPMKEHNDDITDHIIAEIRRSKFVIADFTGQRGGVYFEAGFAYGLGLPVIWSCKEDWFKTVISKEVNCLDMNGSPIKAIIQEHRLTHFDLEHYNFIIWKDGEDFYNKLYNRIRATIV